MRQEYMLKKKAWRFGKKNAWRTIASCCVCGAGIPEWRTYIPLSFCNACEDELDEKKYQ